MQAIRLRLCKRLASVGFTVSAAFFVCLAGSELLDSAGMNVWLARAGYALGFPFLEFGRITNLKVDVGLWAFVSFVIMVLCLTFLRALDLGLWQSRQHHPQGAYPRQA